MKPILVIGSLNMDLVVTMDRLPETGETVLGSSIEYIPGGKGANQAYAASMLRGDVTMLGSVGNDLFREKLRNNLAKAGTNVTYLKTSEEHPSGTAIINVDKEGQNNIVVIAAANQDCDEEYLRSHEFLFDKHEYILLQMEVPQQACYAAIRLGKQKGKTVVLNPAPAPDQLPDDIYRLLDYLTPNETELSRLSGMPCETLDQMKQAAEVLLAKGVGHVLVTLGDKGALLVGPQGCQHHPTTKAEAVDTTAAGDCFNAAFVVALAEGKSHQQAIRFANLAAGVSVTRKGAQSSLPSREEVDNLLDNTVNIPATVEI